MPTSHPDGDNLVTASEIARLAGVSPSAVSQWRKRFPDFPVSAGTAPSGGDLFQRADIEAWLRQHPPQAGRKKVGVEQQIWSVAERLRGRALAGDLVGLLAACVALVHITRQERDLPPVRQGLEALGRWAQAASERVSHERADLSPLFEPLFVIEPQSLGLLVDSFSPCQTTNDLIGVFEDLAERATRYSGFVPEAISEFITEIARPAGTVFDPAAGTGELLLSAARSPAENLELFGLEPNESAWRVAVARLLLRGIDARLLVGDSLEDDDFFDVEADVILTSPPLGGRKPDRGDAVGDSRWQLLGAISAPPPSASDFAWLAHVVEHLAQDGRGYVLLTSGSLLRRGAEARFRAELVRQGTIEAIITLPRRSGPTSVGAALALWVVRPTTTNPPPVLLIDAANEKALSRSLRARVADVVDTWRSHPEQFRPEAGFAVAVPVLELLTGDAVLLPSRWLFQPTEAQTLIDNVKKAHAALKVAHGGLPKRLPEVELAPAPDALPPVRVGELVEAGLVSLLRPARIKTDQYGDEGLPVWIPADINDPWRRHGKQEYIDPTLVDARSITKPGDIVFTTIGGLRTRVDEEGDHVLGTSLHAMRLSSDSTFEPHAFAALLTSEPNRNLLTGTTIPRVNILELVIPRLDLESAERLRTVLDGINHELAAATEIARHADELRQALIDAIAAGAATMSIPAGE